MHFSLHTAKLIPTHASVIESAIFIVFCRCFKIKMTLSFQVDADFE